MGGILLTHSNHLYSDSKQVAKMQPYPPLQTMICAAVLRDHGFETALFDPTLVDPLTGFAQALDKHLTSLVIVCEDDFNFLTKMCLLRNRALAFHMAAECSARGIRLVVHGADASDRTAEYLDAGFDCVLRGEVEQTVLDLAAGNPLERVSGLAFRGVSGVERTPARVNRTDLRDLPHAAWDTIDIELYREHWLAAHGYFSLNLYSSRGCPYRCNWCAKPVWGSNYRVRSASAVAAEMLHLKETYRPDRIWFADDIFALSPKWTSQFAASVAQCSGSIPFTMQSRCDLMTRDTIHALKSAGCMEVWMGAESGSQRILSAMDKDIAVEQIYRARENLALHGIRACFFLQFGYLGEDWSDIEATISMVRRAAPDDIGVSVSYPLPNTKFHQIVSAKMGARQNWTDSGDLQAMFPGRYSTAFYRALADALHREVRGLGGARAAWEEVDQLRTSVETEALVA